MFRRVTIAALALIAGIVGGLIFLLSGGGDHSVDDDDTTTEAPTAPPARNTSAAPPPPPPGQRSAPGDRAERERGERHRRDRRVATAARGERSDDVPRDPAPGRSRHGDPEADAHEREPGRQSEGGDRESDSRRWEDPVNQRVLGDKRWMAPTSSAEQKRIDEVFERDPPEDPRLDVEDRRTAVETARVVVDGCYADVRTQHPDAQGRVAVGFDAWAHGGEGYIEAPYVIANVKLRYPGFETCIVEGLEGATFQARDDGEPRNIEYPFFYE